MGLLRPFLLLLATATVAWLSAPAAGSTLTPGHPVWSRPGIDHHGLGRAQRVQARLRAPRAPRPRTYSKGFERYASTALVLPVVYADAPVPPSIHLDSVRQRLFDADDPSSLAGYFAEASSERFVPDGYVMNWIELPGDRNLYSNVRDGTAAPAAGPQWLVRDAVRIAGRRLDLRAFDNDGPDGVAGSGDDDGFVDLLIVLHPDVGFEVDPVAVGPAMLAHQGRIPLDAERPHPDVAADAYALFSVRGPLGVWAHETAHLLGLDDLYDLDVSGTLQAQPERGGLGVWSLMAHGTWGGGGDRPSNLDAFSRRLLGWEDVVTDVLVPGTWVLDPVERGRNQSLRITPFGEWNGEEFLLENRRRRAEGVVDTDLPASGVLVYRHDPNLALNEQSEGYGLQLLEADGDDAIAQLLDNGAPGDVFLGPPGAAVIDRDTTPSTQSRVPGPERVAPRIEIAAPDAQDGHIVTIRMAPGPDLRLLEASFPQGTSDRRTFLGPGEVEPWRLRFRPLGDTPPTSAWLEVVSVDPRLEVTGDNPVELVEVGSWWETISTLTVRSTQLQAESIAPVIGLELTVDGGLPRSLELGVPIAANAGLRGEDFFFFAPAVLAGGPTPTTFEVLPVADLPLPASSGWRTEVNGQADYNDGVDITLTSPWFSIPPRGELVFWSTHETEDSDPGQAWDGGILELYAPGRGWMPLRPVGPATVLINRVSEASTRGRVGLGGPFSPWQSYTAELPDLAAPVRVRLRFGSDATLNGGSWSVAHLATSPAPARAEVTVERDPFGAPVGRADLSGDFTGITRGRFRARRPLESVWTDASDLQQVRADLPTIFAALTLPAGADALRVAFFAEAPDGSSPDLLLGSTALRIGDTTTSLRALSSPSFHRVEFAITPQNATRHLEFFDLRGRRLRTLVVEPQIQLVLWDGRDDQGRRVSAGRYLARLRENPDIRSSLILLH